MRWKGQGSLYNNRKTPYDGYIFDSLDEAKYWQYLKLLEASGEISALLRQVDFILTVNSRILGIITWDFAYMEKGQRIAFDWKGYKNQERIWNWKRKHVEAEYPHWKFKTNLDKEKKKSEKRIRR